MFYQSPSVIPAHTPGTYDTSRAPHLRVSLVVYSASYFAGAALTVWLWMAGCGWGTHVALCRYPGWTILRCDATHGLCGVCLCHDLCACSHYPPCHPGP